MGNQCNKFTIRFSTLNKDKHFFYKSFKNNKDSIFCIKKRGASKTWVQVGIFKGNFKEYFVYEQLIFRKNRREKWISSCYWFSLVAILRSVKNDEFTINLSLEKSMINFKKWKKTFDSARGFPLQGLTKQIR